jgi:hypothetical protein
LWPIAVSSGDETLVSIQENALDFPCNRPRQPDRICESLAETLQVLFKVSIGVAFLEQGIAEARDLVERAD